MITFTQCVTQQFYVVSCYNCGVPFGIESGLYRRVVTNAIGSLFCPACGDLTCWRESDDQKRIKELQRKLQWEAAEVSRQKAAREAAEASLKAIKGVATKLKKRVAFGVCPCCNRTFKQLSVHMSTKHPEFVKDHATA